MDIHIIGTGKLGRTLAQILHAQDIHHSVYGRTFPKKLKGLVYICVSEHSIVDVATQLVYHDDVVVLHASGSLGLEVFPTLKANVGCLHPIQSFPGPEIRIPDSIPSTLLLSDDTDSKSQHEISEFTRLLGFTVYPFVGDRLAYHTAAVLSGNFTTILFSLAKEVLEREGYTPETASNMLYSLAKESLLNAQHGSLKQVLTGPIARSQQNILEQQKERLNWDEDLQSLYHLFTILAQNRLR